MSKTRNKQLSIYHRLYIDLQKSQIKIKGQFNQKLKESKLSISFDQWLILQEINMTLGINQKTIAQNLSKDVASISRILTKLEKGNFVTKEVNKENSREFKLYLKPAGIEVIHQTKPEFEKIFKQQFAGIYEQELNLLLDILKRINN